MAFNVTQTVIRELSDQAYELFVNKGGGQERNDFKLTKKVTSTED